MDAAVSKKAAPQKNSKADTERVCSCRNFLKGASENISHTLDAAPSLLQTLDGTLSKKGGGVMSLEDKEKKFFFHAACSRVDTTEGEFEGWTAIAKSFNN